MTPSYFNNYENLAIDRTESGILTVRFHTDGGPIVFTGQTHRDLPRALAEIGEDRDNKVVILTGTGNVFMDEIDGHRSARSSNPANGTRSTGRGDEFCNGLDLPPRHRRGRVLLVVQDALREAGWIRRPVLNRTDLVLSALLTFSVRGWLRALRFRGAWWMVPAASG